MQTQPPPPVQQAMRFEMPAVPEEFSQLETMSVDELTELNENDAKLLEFYESLDVVKEIKRQEENYRARNESLAGRLP